MIEAITFEYMLSDLRERYKLKKRTFGILLVRPNGTAASEEILNDIQYFHRRSSNKLDIYLPGYGAYWGNEIPDAIGVCKVGSEMWSYSAGKFSDFVETLESVCSWKYHSEIELLLLDFKETDISFKKVVRINLNAALRDGAIYSAASFIERVIGIFKENKSAFEVSDALTLNELGNSISDVLKEKSSIYNIFRRSRHFTIRSYEKKS